MTWKSGTWLESRSALGNRPLGSNPPVSARGAASPLYTRGPLCRAERSDGQRTMLKSYTSLRTSDRCHWCGNPFPNCAPRESGLPRRAASVTPRNDVEEWDVAGIEKRSGEQAAGEQSPSQRPRRCQPPLHKGAFVLCGTALHSTKWAWKGSAERGTDCHVAQWAPRNDVEDWGVGGTNGHGAKLELVRHCEERSGTE